MDAQALKCLGYRGFAKASRGEVAPEHIILKLFSSEAERRACLLGTDVQGAGSLDLGGSGPSPWRSRVRPATASSEGVAPIEPGDTDYRQKAFGVDPGLLNEFDSGPWITQYLRSFSGTIAGGTSEIQRNIVAERVLGLPR